MNEPVSDFASEPVSDASPTPAPDPGTTPAPRTPFLFDLSWTGLLLTSLLVVAVYEWLFPPTCPPKTTAASLLSVDLDRFGNPSGDQYGLARDGEFEGQRIIAWSSWGEVQSYVLVDDHPLWRALRKKGFEIELHSGKFNPSWLSRANQLWIFSGREHVLTRRDYAALEEFLRGGKGIYLSADNDPFTVEATELAQRLFGTTIEGNFAGGENLAVRGGGITQEDLNLLRRDGTADKSRIPGVRAPEEVIAVAHHYVEEHDLLTGVLFLYEGISVSHIEPSRQLFPVLVASDGQTLAAVPQDDTLRIVLDCGWTRYWSKPDEDYINQTAGTVRYAENIAAFLAGKRCP